MFNIFGFSAGDCINFLSNYRQNIHVHVCTLQKFQVNIVFMTVIRLGKTSMLSRLRLGANDLGYSRTLNSSLLKSSLAAMCIFILPNTKPQVLVHLSSDLSQEQLLSFPAFKTWVATLQRSLSLQQNKSHTFHSTQYMLRTIEIQSVDFFSGERIGFIKLKAEVSNDKGEKLPGSVFVCIFRISATIFWSILES